jgi:hypothetical protein
VLGCHEGRMSVVYSVDGSTSVRLGRVVLVYTRRTPPTGNDEGGLTWISPSLFGWHVRLTKSNVSYRWSPRGKAIDD